MKGEHFRNPRAELPDVCVGGIGNDYVIVSFHLHRQTHSLIHTHKLTHTLAYTHVRFLSECYFKAFFVLYLILNKIAFEETLA